MVSSFKEYPRLQQVGILIGVGYFLVLLGFIAVGGFNTIGLDYLDDEGLVNHDDSKGVFMETVKRVEFKGGQKKWMLLADSVNYEEGVGIALMSKPIVSIFEEGVAEPTVINSNSARILSESGVVKTAFLEGNVKMRNADGAMVESEFAEYMADEEKIRFPNHAAIVGEGYRVEGKNLVVQTKLGILDFNRDVDSRFESGIKTNVFKPINKIKGS